MTPGIEAKHESVRTSSYIITPDIYTSQLIDRNALSIDFGIDTIPGMLEVNSNGSVASDQVIRSKNYSTADIDRMEYLMVAQFLARWKAHT
jgi:hypothetical protein